MEHNIFEHDGCSIHYWIVGDKRQPLITFIHGAGADHHIFNPQIASIAQHFRVLLWDLRCHGQSRSSTIPFSIHTSVEDLVALLDHLKEMQTSLVGISLGGTIAQEFVYLFPQRVIALAIVGIPCNTLAITPTASCILWIFMLIVRYAPPEFVKRLLSFFAAVQQEPRTYVYQAYSQFSREQLLQVMEAFHDVFRNPRIPPNYHITHPLLIIHGQNDNIGNLMMIPRWVRRDFHCHYVIVPKAGHLTNWDEAHYFNQQLLSFLQEYTLQYVSDHQSR